MIYRLTTLLIILLISASGTFAKDIVAEQTPFGIEKALQEAREARRLEGVKDVNIILKAGVYNVLQSIIIRPEDNGTCFKSKGKTVISGGVEIKDWKKEGRMLVADVPMFNGRPLEFRQLYVNGKKAVRARDVQDFEKMYRILSMDKQKEVLYVPVDAVKNIVRQSKNYAAGLEMTLHEMWCVANLRVRKIDMMGDSAAVYFHNPESHIHFSHPWPSPMTNTDGHNSAFYLSNDRSLLDCEGEWYLDTKQQKLYYIPQKGETAGNIKVVAPAVETLLKSEGTPDNLVSNITFENISFEHSTWMRPSIEGHTPLQAGMYMIEAYKLRPKMERPNGDHKLDNQGWVGRPAAAVLLNNAENIRFQNCTFQHLASTGLDYHTYIKGGEVSGCEFTDIGGTAILAGSFGPEGFEQHRPYDPSDRRIICDGLTIDGNKVHDVTTEDWGCIGIAAGWVRNIKITNNEISDVSYTGISLGWGWNQQNCAMGNNLVKGNYIHHYAKHMYDTAGIYTLGSQPHTFIEENTVKDIYTPSYVHDPNHWFYLYTDEGSSYITVRNNWCPAEKFLKNANGPGNTWENNGPISPSPALPLMGGRD